MKYDIIGDVHGQAGKLNALLFKLGYRRIDGTYRHPLSRVALFLGDLIDRVRDLSLDLRPAMLDDFGLLPALRWLFERFHRQVR